MHIRTKAQQACYEKLKQWLQEIYHNDVYMPDDELPIFALHSGSAIAVVEVQDYGDDEALISIWSYVVTGANIQPDLLDYLLRQNNKIRFGGFSLDPEDDILFHAELIGSTCDKKEIETSVNTVLQTADEYDDIIVKTWGGERAIDRMLELGAN
ncbi:MAG: T3SS (YopN, CesT) and YbjN peptide-binding chaperone 1 [Pseudanabaenaceae cyanobacterium]